MVENWKDIIGWEGVYQVSDNGRIRSVSRQTSNGKCDSYIRNGIDIKSYPNKIGYLVVTLSDRNKKKMVTVHRTIAEAFIPNPENKPCVNHKDGNKLNNYISNLEWCTYSENNKHAYRTKLKLPALTGRFGSQSPVSKQIYQFTLDDDFICSYWGRFEAEKMTGIKESNIKYALSSNSHITAGFKWIKKDDYDKIQILKNA